MVKQLLWDCIHCSFKWYVTTPHCGILCTVHICTYLAYLCHHKQPIQIKGFKWSYNSLQKVSDSRRVLMPCFFSKLIANPRWNNFLKWMLLYQGFIPADLYPAAAIFVRIPVHTLMGVILISLNKGPDYFSLPASVWVSLIWMEEKQDGLNTIKVFQIKLWRMSPMLYFPYELS